MEGDEQLVAVRTEQPQGGLPPAIQHVATNGVHHHHALAPPPPPGPDGRVLYVAWSRLHPHKTISIPPGTQIYPHELKEALYAALLRADGRSIISREEFNKQLFVGLYYVHKGESRLLPLSVLVQRLDYFSTKRLYLIDPDMVVHEWSVSIVRSAVVSLLVLLLLLIFVKGLAMGTFIFLTLVFIFLSLMAAVYLAFTLLPQSLQDIVEAALNSVAMETLLSSSAAQVLLVLVLMGIACALPQSQHLTHAAAERVTELVAQGKDGVQALRQQATVLLVSVDNYSDSIFAFLYEHGWLGLPLELAREDERRSYTHLCSRLFSNGVGFWEMNFDMCEKLLTKRVRASALQMKKGTIMLLLCASFIWVLNRLTCVPTGERKPFSWVTLIEWCLVLGFATMTFLIPFDTFDLSPGFGSF